MNVLGWTALLYCGNMKGPEINSIYSAVSPNWILTSFSHSQKWNISHKRIRLLKSNLLLLNNVKTIDSLAICPFIPSERGFNGRAGNMSCFAQSRKFSVVFEIWVDYLAFTIYHFYVYQIKEAIQQNDDDGDDDRWWLWELRCIFSGSLKEWTLSGWLSREFYFRKSLQSRDFKQIFLAFAKILPSCQRKIFFWILLKAKYIISDPFLCSRSKKLAGIFIPLISFLCPIFLCLVEF